MKAEYTEEAKAEPHRGQRSASTAVVLADGKVGDVTVTESLDSIYGLDKNAVTAMKQWESWPSP